MPQTDEGQLAKWYAMQKAAMADGMTHAQASDYADQCLGWINEAKAVHEQAGPQTERAVMDNEFCPQRVGIAGSWHHWSAPMGNDGLRTCLDCGAVKDPEPRALCAISEDRQWLVILEGGDWRIRKRSNNEFCLLDEAGGGWVIDIGLSAEDVLREFMESRSE